MKLYYLHKTFIKRQLFIKKKTITTLRTQNNKKTYLHIRANPQGITDSDPDSPLLIAMRYQVPFISYNQGPTSTRYSNRTRIFLYYSNPTRNFFKNDRVASSMYSSHFRKIAARPASQNYSLIDTDNILLFLI